MGRRFTILAPTDVAFAEMSEDKLARLLNGQVRLDELVSCHVVPGQHGAAQLVGIGFVRTLHGLTVAIDAVETALLVDAALVVQSDIEADNGVIHMIDRVLVPEGVRDASTSAGVTRPDTPGRLSATAGTLFTARPHESEAPDSIANWVVMAPLEAVCTSVSSLPWSS